MEVLEPVECFLAHDLAVREEREVLVIQMEVFERVKDAPGAGEHAVAAAFGQVSGEDLENAWTIRGPVFERGVQHGVLVHVGHQCR